MEDQQQEMGALKKVYAEVILNTAKEAAARTMASERKSLRLHHDLCSTKDEALRMLLRFKHMIDVKTTEAETTSLGQQKRIEELDAKLNEAEEVILDLRSEIRKAHERLAQVKNTHVVQCNGPSENKHLHQEIGGQNKTFDVTEQFRCDQNCNPPKETNLPSIVIRNKEPELYRNGYTHRIRAIERNLVDEKIISENKPDDDISIKRDLIINAHEKQCAPSSMVADNTYTHTDSKNINCSTGNDQSVKIQRLPRSSVIYAQKTLKVNSRGKDAKLTSSEPSASSLCRSIRKRKVRCWDDISSLFKSCSALSRCKKYSDDGGVKIETPSTDASKKTKYDDEDTKLLTEPVVEKQELAAKESDNVACDTDNNSVLKFTFSRKSKKVISPKSDILTSLMKEKLSSSPNNKKHNLIEDPSCDSQNMVDIACQLVKEFTASKMSSANNTERIVYV